MKIEEFKLVCIYDSVAKVWVVFPESMPAIVVEVDTLSDAPKEIATSYRYILEHGFKEGIHIHKNFQSIRKNKNCTCTENTYVFMHKDRAYCTRCGLPYITTNIPNL